MLYLMRSDFINVTRGFMYHDSIYIGLKHIFIHVTEGLADAKMD